MTSIDNCSYLYGPTIEDRLENTEKLIRQMNAKFEDIASSKNSAKLEFNKLVQNLTKPRNCGHKDCESESNEDNE